MNRPAFYLLLLGLIAAPLTALVGASGCANAIDVTGKWKGTCEFDLGGYNQDVDIEFEIKSQDDGDLEGDLDFAYAGYDYDGDLEGDLDEADVEFTVELDTPDGYTYEFSFEGTVEGEDMTGDGEWSVGGYSYDAECEFEWD